MHKSTTGYLSSAYIHSERRHAPTAASRPSGRFRYICKNSERSMKRLFTTFAFALATLCISACDSPRQPLFTANPLGAGPVLLTDRKSVV